MVQNSENYKSDIMNNQNFDEWTREQKEEFAKKRMEEMRKKNEDLQKRYAEVESDRIAAESKNSAITVALKSQQKEKSELMKSEGKPEYAREWDRGKPDKDHWQPPESNSFKSYGPGRFNRNSDRREQSRFNRTSNDYYDRNDSRVMDDRRRSDQAQDHRGGHRSNNYEQPQYRGSRQRRGNAYRGNDSFRKPQHFTDERHKSNYHDRTTSAKKNSNRAHSRSPSWSGSDHELRKELVQQSSTSSANATALWNNESYKEYQNAQNRVEQWVDNVNSLVSKQFSQPVVSEKTNQQFLSEKENNKRDRQSNKFKNFDRSSNRSVDNEDNDCSPAVKTSCDFKTSPQKPNIQRTVYCKGTSNDVDPAMQEDGFRKRGFKPKFSPESVTAHDKGEQFNKQRSFDNQRYSRDSKFRGNKSMFKNDSRNRSGYGNESNRYEKFTSNRNSNSQTSETRNQSSDSWGSREVTPADDGIWNNAQQTDVKWKLSDEETDFSQKYVMSAKDVEKDTWNDNSEGSNVNQKQNKKSNPQNPDGLWGNVEQSDVKWNVPDKETDTRGNRRNNVSDSLHKNRDKTSVSRNKNIEKDGWHSDQPAGDEVDGTWGNVDQSGAKWNLSDSD